MSNTSTYCILAIVGPSGSGKTTLAKAMEHQGSWHDIISYTTRQMRSGERDGVEHHFLTHADYDTVYAYIEKAAYTCIANEHYFVLAEQLTHHPFQTYVIDEAGLLMLQRVAFALREMYHIIVIPVHITRSLSARIASGVDTDRIRRDIERDQLPPEAYTLHIHNNCSTSAELEAWADTFARWMRCHISDIGIDDKHQPITLYTNQPLAL